MIKIVSPWFIKTFRGRNVVATTFFPFVVIFKSQYWANDRATINHEAIHGHQMLECLVVFSAILILLWPFIKGGRNPFEEEAHINEDNLFYLKTRKPYAWRKYL